MSIEVDDRNPEGRKKKMLAAVANSLWRIYGGGASYDCTWDTVSSPGEGPPEGSDMCIGNTCEAPACAAGSERGPLSDE